MAGEEEQVEQLKKWWSENGKSMLAGLAIGLAAVVGWSSWQTWERSQTELASARYAELVDDAAAGRHTLALSQAEAIAGEFPDSAYASLASLIGARAAVLTDAPDKARQHLEWVVEHASFPELVPIARLRLARLKLDAGQYDDALAELDRIDSAPFLGSVAELRGDIHRARGDRDAARESYESLLGDAELSQTTRLRVQMKLDDLGELTFSPSG